MLSYRHAFHAGNHADILKHLVLFLCGEYLTQKDKPLMYHDTHAGAGMYQLSHEHAQKTQEYLNGIQRLYDATNPPADIQRFIDTLDRITQKNRQLYPGSPAWAKALLRPAQRLVLHELHNTDRPLLQKYFKGDRRVTVENSDGYQGLIARMPPIEKRALVLIDPSYEIKQEYQTVIETLQKACKRFRTGVYLVWYPVIERKRANYLKRGIEALNMPLLHAELMIEPDHEGLGMTGSGMFVINPPYQLEQQLSSLLPWLKTTLASEQGDYTLQQANIA